MLKIQNLLNFRVSKITVFFGLFIIISAAFMNQLVEYIQSYIGKKGVEAFLALLMILACLVFLIFVTQKGIHTIRTPSIIVVLAAGLILAWQVKFPAEKIHVLEYGFLGWLAAKDLIKVNKKGTGIVLACLFCIFVGILDEAFQRVLPYRVYEVRDMAINALGGAWGVILYLLT
jgi:VanZ family protein